MQKSRALQLTALVATSVGILALVPVLLNAQDQPVTPPMPPGPVARAGSHPVAMNSQYVYVVNGNELLQYNRSMEPVRKVTLEQAELATAAQSGGRSSQSSSDQSGTTNSTQQSSQSQSGSARASGSASASGSARGSASGSGSGLGFGSGGGGGTYIAANDMAVIVTRGGMAYIYDSDNLTPRNAVPIP